APARPFPGTEVAVNRAPTRPAAAWSRGRPLAERLPMPPDLSGDHATGGVAERRFHRWRRQAPFDDDALWRARLRTDGIDEATLRRLLAEPAEALARRLGPPGWPREIPPPGPAESLTRRLGPPEWPDEILPPGLAASPPAPIPTATGEDHPFLARAARPLIDTAYARMRAALTETAGNRPGIVSPDQLLDQLFP